MNNTIRALTIFAVLFIVGIVAVATAYAFSQTRIDNAFDASRERQARDAEPYQADNSDQPVKTLRLFTAADKPSETEVIHNELKEWMLILVNAENPLPDDFSPDLKSLPNGLLFDARAIDSLNKMLSAMRKQGLSPVVCSAYRSVDYQRTLFDNKVSKLMSAGLSKNQAETEARKSVAYPGTSEHNSGLAADIVSMGYQVLDDEQANTEESKWLRERCAEYGFILRYPSGKEDITGVMYEPWHFRYVGAEAAAEITENGLCLEEYLAAG